MNPGQPPHKDSSQERRPSSPKTTPPQRPDESLRERWHRIEPTVATGLLWLLQIILMPMLITRWMAAGAIIAGFATIPMGLWAYRRLAGERAPFLKIYLGFVIVTATLVSFSLLLMLVLLWPEFSEYMQCLGTALTDEGLVSCDRDLSPASLLQNLLHR